MTLQVNPVVVVGIGSVAERIINRAQELIILRHRLDSMPMIFQFLVLSEETDVEECIVHACKAALNKLAALQIEQIADISVTGSRVESFIIVPLNMPDYEIAIRAAHALKECPPSSVAGGRNAIFLVSKGRDSLNPLSLQAAAVALESELESSVTFNRCFFIDEVDELGQTITEAELIEVVARFISLATASELSRRLITTPPPYWGYGPHHNGNASFSCGTLGFDPQKLGDLLSTYLAHDIRQRLFGGQRVRSNETKFSEQAHNWFEESMKRSVTNSSSSDLSDISCDVDFIEAKNQLDEFTRDACRSLSYDLGTYQEVIDTCLNQGIIQLESHSNKMRAIKKEINEIEIKIMLGIPCGQESAVVVEQISEKPLTWIIALGIAGIGLAILLLVVGQSQSIAIATGSLFILGALVLWIVGRKRDVHGRTVIATSHEKELGEKKHLYSRQRKLQNIHLLLSIYLDLAYANLEHLRTNTIDAAAETSRSIFDVDLTDAELAKKYYSKEYETKEADISAFIGEHQMNEFHRGAFSFFDVKLFDLLNQFCHNRFTDIRKYDLGQILHLEESLEAHSKLITASRPFWHPLNPESDKIVLVITGDHSAYGIRTFLNNTFGANNLYFVDSQDSTSATLVQIAYGQKLTNILGLPVSK